MCPGDFITKVSCLCSSPVTGISRANSHLDKCRFRVSNFLLSICFLPSFSFSLFFLHPSPAAVDYTDVSISGCVDYIPRWLMLRKSVCISLGAKWPAECKTYKVDLKKHLGSCHIIETNVFSPWIIEMIRIIYPALLFFMVLNYLLAESIFKKICSCCCLFLSSNM